MPYFIDKNYECFFALFHRKKLFQKCGAATKTSGWATSLRARFTPFFSAGAFMA